MLDFLIFAAVVIVCLIVTIIYLYPVRMWQLALYLLHARYTVVSLWLFSFVQRRYELASSYPARPYPGIAPGGYSTRGLILDNAKNAPKRARNGHTLSTKWALAATNHLSSHGLCSQSKSCSLRQGGVLLGL